MVQEFLKILIIILVLFIAIYIGIHLGRNKFRPLPNYDRRVEEEKKKQLSVVEVEKAKLQLEVEQQKNQLLLAYEQQKAQLEIEYQRRKNEVNERIQQLNEDSVKANITKETINNERNSLELIVKGLREKIELMENQIKTYESDVVQQKKRIIEHERYKRQQELESLKREYDDLNAQAKVAILNIQANLQEWSEMERIAYEDRANKEEIGRRNRLSLSENAIEELQELYGACRKLRLANPVPLYKAIYDIYFKGVVKELGVRLGAVDVCGIYKITNVENGKVYVGQSVDISERWKQHIKRGTKCDAGTMAGASLYDAMWNEGVWNFSFQVLEECKKEDLNAREKAWIAFFQSNEIGYNQKG